MRDALLLHILALTDVRCEREMIVAAFFGDLSSLIGSAHDAWVTSGTTGSPVWPVSGTSAEACQCLLHRVCQERAIRILRDIHNCHFGGSENRQLSYPRNGRQGHPGQRTDTGTYTEAGIHKARQGPVHGGPCRPGCGPQALPEGH